MCLFFVSLSSPEFHSDHRRISLQAARSHQLPSATFCHTLSEGRGISVHVYTKKAARLFVWSMKSGKHLAGTDSRCAYLCSRYLSLLLLFFSFFLFWVSLLFCTFIPSFIHLSLVYFLLLTHFLYCWREAFRVFFFSFAQSVYIVQSADTEADFLEGRNLLFFKEKHSEYTETEWLWFYPQGQHICLCPPYLRIGLWLVFVIISLIPTKLHFNH